MIHRHESLRTSFALVKEEPVQIVHSTSDFKIDRYDISTSSADAALEVERIVKGFIRPFDLSKAPLLRVGLIKLGKEKHILVLDIHHIVTDEISNEIFVNDFMSLHRGEELSPLRVHYKDYG